MNLELEQPLLEVVQKAMAFAVFVITFELKDNFTTKYRKNTCDTALESPKSKLFIEELRGK